MSKLLPKSKGNRKKIFCWVNPNISHVTDVSNRVRFKAGSFVVYNFLTETAVSSKNSQQKNSILDLRSLIQKKNVLF